MNQINAVSKRLLVLVVPGLVAACSGDTSDGTDSGSTDVTKIGFIEINDPEANNSLEMFGFFVETASEVKFSDVLPVSEFPVAEDSCEVDISEFDDDANDSGLQIGDVSANLIFAGEVITVSGPSGTIAEMRQQGFNEFYSGFVTLTDETASGLTMDIPGGDFTAFSALPIPDVEPFVLTSHSSGDYIAIDSTTTWQQGSASNSAITLYSDIVFNDGTIGGDQTSTLVEIFCVLVDDGSFTFSPEIQTQLSVANITELPLHVAREAVNYRQAGDVLVVLNRSSGDP